MTPINVDVCVIGCGAGGYGAARSALDQGKTVAIVDKNPGPGGMNVYAYASQWPAGPAEDIAESLYNDMKLLSPNDVTIGKNYGAVDGAGLWFNADTSNIWDDTLNKVKNGKEISKKDQRLIIYDAFALRDAMNHQLKSYGSKVTVLYNTTLNAVQTSSDNSSIDYVDCINLIHGTLYQIKASVYVDGSGTLALSRLCGCPTNIGEDEESGVNNKRVVVNAASLNYKLVKTTNASTSAKNTCLDFASSNPKQKPSAYVTGLKGGNIYVTTLPYSVVDGSSILSNTNEEMIQIGKAMVDCNWKWLNSVFNGSNIPAGLDLTGYEFAGYSPMFYIRESYRLVSEYVLTKHDILDGLNKQLTTCPDVVALGQALFDFHPGPFGNDNITFKEPGVYKTYGVPYRAMVPVNFKNMLVACTGSGFSHIAASSARLQKMLMGLGHAAGYAASLCIDKGSSINVMDVYNDSSLLDKLVKEMQKAYGMTSNWASGKINH